MGATPGVDRGQVRVTGITITHEGPGELREHSTGVDVHRRAATDVHQRQSARHMHIRQLPGRATGGLIGVEHRRGG
jgi:hypothetical protein